MSISHGVFVPGWLGTFPKEYTQSDIHPYLGSGLPDVEASEDPFVQWETMHPWLLDTHAREALNTYDFRVHRPPGVHSQDNHGLPRRPAKTANDDIVRSRPLHADDLTMLLLDKNVLGTRSLVGSATTERHHTAERHAGRRPPSGLLAARRRTDVPHRVGNLVCGGVGVSRVGRSCRVEKRSLSHGETRPILRSLTTIASKSTQIPTPSTSPHPRSAPLFNRADDRSVLWPRWWGEDRGDLQLYEGKILDQREAFTGNDRHGQILNYLRRLPVGDCKERLARVDSYP